MKGKSRADFLIGYLIFNVLLMGTGSFFIPINNSFANDDDSATTESAQKTQKEESHLATAVFAGGCFWCMEPPFDKVKGVVATTSGYTGGETPNPTYYEVSNKQTGHFEALKVTYDPSVVRYEDLLDIFWKNIDPLDARGQFCDKGAQYRSAIFVANDKERKLAEASKEKVPSKMKVSGKIETLILDRKEFYDAEDYHQDYYLKNKLRYKYYRYNCGRDQRLEKVWGAKF